MTTPYGVSRESLERNLRHALNMMDNAAHDAMLRQAELEKVVDAEVVQANDHSPAERATDSSRTSQLLLQYVVGPVVAAALSAAAVLGAAFVADDKKGSETQSCIQVYSGAMEIADKHPGFKMPQSDPDQQRCKVNEVLDGVKPPAPPK